MYVSTQLTPELELEGYAREFMRRVQSLRKDAGLTKEQQISLTVQLSEKLQEAVRTFESQIKYKCGVENIISDAVSSSQKQTGKIKEESFEIGF